MKYRSALQTEKIKNCRMVHCQTFISMQKQETDHRNKEGNDTEVANIWKPCRNKVDEN